MNKVLVGLLVIVAVVVVTVWTGYNGIVTKDEDVSKSWSEVQNQLKRRSDLIPNLVKTVEEYAKHERGVFNEVTEARAKVSQAININASDLANNPMLQKQLSEAQQSLNASLSRLIAVSENYPDLKANQNFLKLQDELAGTENRIAVARGRAIDSTNSYNASRRRFPVNLLANFFGFGAKEYYKAEESAQAVPVVFN